MEYGSNEILYCYTLFDADETIVGTLEVVSDGVDAEIISTSGAFDETEVVCRGDDVFVLQTLLGADAQ